MYFKELAQRGRRYIEELEFDFKQYALRYNLPQKNILKSIEKSPKKERHTDPK